MRGGMTGRVGTLVVAAAVSAAADRQGAAPPAPPSCTDTGAVVARAVAYVDEFGRALTELLAAEDYEQALHLPGDAPQRQHNEAPTAPAPVTMRGTLPGTERTVAVRRLRASFLFLRTPSDGAWLGFRDVTHVNGRRVDAARRAALDVPGEPALARWRRLSEESARFNLGTTARTINAPTFALVVLQAQHHARFSFASSNEPRRRGSRCVLTFQETARPTIVRGVAGAALPASGTFLIDRTTGRVEQSTFSVGAESAGVASTSTVTYARNGTLGLWLPKRCGRSTRRPGSSASPAWRRIPATGALMSPSESYPASS